MSTVIADPEKLRAFAAKLQSYLNKLQTETDSLQAAFRDLRGSWTDEKGASFEKTLHELVNAQAAFKDNACKQIPHLRGMASDLEQYKRR